MVLKRGLCSQKRLRLLISFELYKHINFYQALDRVIDNVKNHLLAISKDEKRIIAVPFSLLTCITRPPQLSVSNFNLIFTHFNLAKSFKVTGKLYTCKSACALLAV